MTDRVLVSGAGGFIGWHLVNYLKVRGYWVRGVDIKDHEFAASAADEFELRDLREPKQCAKALKGIDQVYNLAADMGGIGYITGSHASIAMNNTLINANMLGAAHRLGIKKYFYSSSACIYPQYAQSVPDIRPLKEDQAYPADAEEGYGWEKLYAEKLCQYYWEDHGFPVSIARFHNVYGPVTTYEGGKEKAPAALCRKIALVPDGGTIKIWGDGNQTRSFMHVKDCVEGIYRIANSDYHYPLNLGRDEMVTINALADVIAKVAGKQITKEHISGPQGVRGRNSDNRLCRSILHWEPKIALEEGLRDTYRWIADQIDSTIRTQGALA